MVAVGSDMHLKHEFAQNVVVYFYFVVLNFDSTNLAIFMTKESTFFPSDRLEEEKKKKKK